MTQLIRALDPASRQDCNIETYRTSDYRKI